MFYSTQILAKKGPLGLVWIAAHMDRQLKRNQISEASIPASVDTLLEPEAPLALRLSGQLLLGVVRIYERKVKYLQQDASEALARMRATLKAPPNAAVDLAPGTQHAPYDTITLPGGAGMEFVGLIEDWDVVLVDKGRLVGSYDHGDDVLDLGMPSGSGMLSQDISEVFGLYSSTEDERFDDAGLPFDLDEVEVEMLRDANNSQTPYSAGVAPGDLLLRGNDTPVENGKGPLHPHSPAHLDALHTQEEQQYGDEMEYEPLLPLGPAQELLQGGGNGRSPAPSSGGWTPGSMGAGGALEALLPTPHGLEYEDMQDHQQEEQGQQAGEQAQQAAGGPALTQEQQQDGDAADTANNGGPQARQLRPRLGKDAAAGAAGGAAGAYARRAQKRGGGAGARRPLAVDAGGTTLPAADVRALLADRSSLLDKGRGRAKRARTAADATDAAPAAAAGGLLAPPAWITGLAPQLQSLFAASVRQGPVLPAEGAAARQAPQSGAPSAGAADGVGGGPATPSGVRGEGLSHAAAGGGADDMEMDGGGMGMQLQEDDYQPLMPLDEAEAGVHGGPSFTPGSATPGHSGGNDGWTPDAAAAADGAPAASTGGGRPTRSAGGAAGEMQDEGPEDSRVTDERMGAASGGGRSAAAAVWEADAEQLLEADEEEPRGCAGELRQSGAGCDANGFTSRTRTVARHITRAAATAASGADYSGAALSATPIGSGGRAKRISAAGMAPQGLGQGPAPVLSLDKLTAGRSRLDACRYVYEVLVLGNRGLVQLAQEQPYGDISITPDAKALAAL